jgi:hypothetical protein
VLVALFAGSAIWAASQEARRSNRMGRARTTMNFIYEWRRQATSQSQKLEEHLGSEEAVEAFADLDDKVTRRLVRDLLEPVEHLALGTMYGAFDEEIVYELTRARVIKLWGRHENYVTAMRRGDPPKHGAQPSAYEHFERLQRELAEREQSETDERRRATQREADKSRRQSQRRAKRAERDARKEQERTARGRRRKLKRVDE